MNARDLVLEFYSSCTWNWWLPRCCLLGNL